MEALESSLVEVREQHLARHLPVARVWVDAGKQGTEDLVGLLPRQVPEADLFGESARGFLVQ
jgi:hypothetical protein